MLTTDPGKHWKAWGEIDPYFGVLTSDEYHADKLGPAAKQAFFESGEQQIEAAYATVRAHVDPSFAPTRALDFGCGVGRLTLPLGRRCTEAVGLDIAPAMLKEAQVNAAHAGVTNVQWLESDDTLSRVTGRFQFIYSTIVFHHIRPEVGYSLLSRLLGLLDPGGVLAVQILYKLHQPVPVQAARWIQARVPLAHQAVNLLRRRPLDTPNMEGNVYSLPVVLELLREAGCQGTYLDLLRSGPCSHAMVYAQKGA